MVTHELPHWARAWAEAVGLAVSLAAGTGLAGLLLYLASALVWQWMRIAGALAGYWAWHRWSWEQRAARQRKRKAGVE